MNHDEANPRSAGSLSLDDRLDRIESAVAANQKSLDEIKDAASGLPLRVSRLEYVLYGSCGIVGVAFIGAVVALVIKATP